MFTPGPTSSVAVIEGAGLAVAIGLASACGFAMANAMQHRAAGSVPASVRRAPEVLRHLSTKPLWLVATLISFGAMLLHGLALKFGSIALVQPLMLVGVVLAVPLRAALERRLPPWPEVRAVLVTVVGLAIFLHCAAPAPSQSAPHIVGVFALVFAGVGVALASLRACGTRFLRNARHQAALLGAAAGVLFGMTAGLLKLTVNSLSSGRMGSTSSIAMLGLLVGVGVMATALNQRAYQIAPISFSMPLVNVVDVLIAVCFGALVFHELPGHTPLDLALQVGALLCIGFGLRGIAHLGHADWCPERARVAGDAR